MTTPALTPEEWRDWINADDANGLGHGVYRLHHQPDTTEHTVLRYVNGITLDGGNDCGEPISPEEQDRHAFAALCLYGQSFGFTLRDYDDLLMAAYELRGLGRGASMRAVLSAAERVKALLPPEGT